MTTAVQLAQSVAPGVSLGFKNRVINGAMMIDQRNAGASITPTAGGTFTLDRWNTRLTVASKYSVQQNAGSVTPPVGFTNYLGVTSLSAYSVLSTDGFALQQNIEGLNTADFAWGSANAATVTLSFKVYSSLTGTFGGAIANSAADRSYPFSYTVSSANTWTNISVTIPGDTTGTWLTTNGIGVRVLFGLGAGSTLSAPAGAWTSGDYRTCNGAVSVVGTNGATFYITGVQLEVGTTATPFEFRDYGRELIMCYRYYWKFSSSDPANPGTYIGIVGFNDSTTNNFCVQQFPVTMRSIPSFTTTGVAANYQIRTGNSGNLTCSSVPAINNYTPQGCDILGYVASGLTAANCTVLRGQSSNAFWAFSAEL